MDLVRIYLRHGQDQDLQFLEVGRAVSSDYRYDQL
jgi:hypothetical protein